MESSHVIHFERQFHEEYMIAFYNRYYLNLNIYVPCFQKMANLIASLDIEV